MNGKELGPVVLFTVCMIGAGLVGYVLADGPHVDYWKNVAKNNYECWSNLTDTVEIADVSGERVFIYSCEEWKATTRKYYKTLKGDD